MELCGAAVLRLLSPEAPRDEGAGDHLQGFWPQVNCGWVQGGKTCCSAPGWLLCCVMGVSYTSLNLCPSFYIQEPPTVQCIRLVIREPLKASYSILHVGQLQTPPWSEREFYANPLPYRQEVKVTRQEVVNAK